MSCKKTPQTPHEFDSTIAMYSNELLHCRDSDRSHKNT